ncbi:MAG TPA: DUF551 domain-containing protein [Polyangiaceae bacterium]|nr:DUF551 domain-containing protein [Polyangiaceae bacterium]
MTDRKEPGQVAYEAWHAERYGISERVSRVTWEDAKPQLKAAWAAAELASQAAAGQTEARLPHVATSESGNTTCIEWISPGERHGVHVGADGASWFAVTQDGPAHYGEIDAVPADCVEAGWVSVEERLPDDDRLVLVWNDDWGPGSWAATGRHVDDGSDAGSWFMEDDDDDPEPITHWRPLPAPPSTEGGANG